jgi:hypothetical protein
MRLYIRGTNMARKKKSASIDERSLSKGQLRKLNALRKSLGDDIAERAFAEWMASSPELNGELGGDRNAQRITEALYQLIESGEIHIPRGGYMIRRGRGRVIIERPEAA